MKDPNRQLDPLTVLWYRKLAATGFRDCEVSLSSENQYYRHDLESSRTARTHLKDGYHEKYFRALGLLANDEKFLSGKNLSDKQKQILSLHADGEKTKQIATAVGCNISFVYSTVRTKIVPLLKEYLKGGIYDGQDDDE